MRFYAFVLITMIILGSAAIHLCMGRIGKDVRDHFQKTNRLIEQLEADNRSTFSK